MATYFMALVELMNNGNDLPPCTSNLEFSDEKQKALNSDLEWALYFKALSITHFISGKKLFKLQ